MQYTFQLRGQIIRAQCRGLGFLHQLRHGVATLLAPGSVSISIPVFRWRVLYKQAEGQAFLALQPVVAAQFARVAKGNIEQVIQNLKGCSDAQPQFAQLRGLWDAGFAAELAAGAPQQLAGQWRQVLRQSPPGSPSLASP